MSLELTLHRSLYRPDAVRTAATAFGELARIDVRDRDHEVVITFADVDADVEEVLLDAFANHALFETVRARRAEGPVSPAEASSEPSDD